ncbi:IclR family transcriptional regulator [Roseibium sp. TrichSKD4]|uniref:IclR family transcriptional regulator n=1 Tax=Roseibium sp. TrichSKD4 TaxID=744980 RepID=UPI0001E563F0|nr:IclR family transcriptional regulator [Roseibium sp. TrichSKD4]EFO34123.1 IclR family transcriptional regulator [Roseibium sp. TrichSKD4]
MEHWVAGDGTVGKAFAVLDRVASFGRPVRFGELLDGSPFPKATLYRLVQTLTGEGALHYDEERQTYSVGLRLVGLAHSAWAQSSLAPIARPAVDALSLECGETVHLAQLDGGQVLYVDKRNALKPIEMYSQAGKVGPAYCTGVGKAMLAFLPDEQMVSVVEKQAFYRFTSTTLANANALKAELTVIRSDGVAYDREEHEPGIICIAAPVLSRRGMPIGALSITTSTQRHTLDDLEIFRQPLLSAATTIADAAEAWQFPA